MEPNVGLEVDMLELASDDNRLPLVVLELLVTGSKLVVFSELVSSGSVVVDEVVGVEVVVDVVVVVEVVVVVSEVVVVSARPFKISYIFIIKVSS